MIKRTSIVVLVMLAGTGGAAAASPQTQEAGIGQPGTMTLTYVAGASWLDASESSWGVGGMASIYWSPWRYLLSGARVSVQGAGPGFMESGLRVSVLDLAPLVGLGATLGRLSASAAVGPALTLSEAKQSGLFQSSRTETNVSVGLALDAGIAVATGRSIDITVRGTANVNEQVPALGLLAGVQVTFGR